MKKIILFLLVLFSAMWAGSAVDAAIIVGRISHIEGEIYRYMDVDESWVATFLQSPAGTQDVLATGDNSRAEIVFPNNQLMRLDENTEIEILNLDDDIAEFTLQSGLVRFYNRSSAGKLIVETARGTAKVGPGSAIDVQADEQAVTVSAVRGEATFHSYDDGVEKIEVLSGSTSLEFLDKSIIAGVGPIDRKWDNWCADREGLWNRNNLVRSEHLPESMQEYAYTIEPYGRWQRIYYRGYYYWAWKPHSVAVGWSPYTTGYWQDWHGSPVWIDYNPWGWATHHHGHWLNMHGAWLWTPYVHVSHVPGVTAIGFSITFGKRYRSHWHPGRVRWIAHNDYIGWLPLAPRETYYGYRKWGPRTVVMRGGVSFSININLSSHRYLDHAVIIPKRHLYNRKSGVINNYNTVKIKNVNKTVIINNYKPLQTAERLRGRRHSIKVTRTGDTVRRIEIKPERRAPKTRKTIRSEKHERKRERSILTQRNMPKERTVTGKYEKGSRRTIEKKRERPILTQRNMPKERTVAGKYEKGSRRTVEKKHSGAIENKRAEVRDKAKRERVVRSMKRTRARTVIKSEKTIVKKRVAANDKPRKSAAKKERSKRRGYGAGQTQVETSRKRIVKQENQIVVTGKNRADTGRQMKKDSRLSQRQVERMQNSDKKAYKENNGKYRENKEPEEDNRERQTARNAHNSKERSISREKRGYGQRSGRDWNVTSLDSRRFR
jgi:hypothetical protein